MRIRTERRMRRWQDRWLLDQMIQLVGLDWDQGRTQKILRNCGPSVASELNEIGRKVQKFTDVPLEFARGGERLGQRGQEAEKAGYEVETWSVLA